MDRFLVGSEYAGHLTDADLGLLASVAAADTGPAVDASSLRSDPVTLLRLLEHPGAFRAVLGGQGEAVPASPFMVFAVSVQRAAAELASAGHVPERTGPRQRVPLFDAPALRDFLAAPARRLFLAELLASFTRVASGRYRARVGGRMRTRRFSELDPVRLAGLLEAVPQAERPGVYRRLLRAAQLPASQQDRLAGPPGIEFWEHLGARWYRAARDLAPVATARLTVVGEVADRFRQARRVLNHVTDQYLFPSGDPWFARPGS
jgi:hypothetical protein